MTTTKENWNTGRRKGEAAKYITKNKNNIRKKIMKKKCQKKIEKEDDQLEKTQITKGIEMRSPTNTLRNLEQYKDRKKKQ